MIGVSRSNSYLPETDEQREKKNHHSKSISSSLAALPLVDHEQQRRPGEERSAALMRKAKRGLKRSEARRSGHRTYVHKQRPEDRLTSGAAFPREIRVRTTHFASESESRAISSASQSPPRGAIRGAGGEGYGGGGGGDAGLSGAGFGGGVGSEGLGDGGGSSWLTTGLMSSSVSWFPTGSWGTKMLQAMTDAARAPAECGVAASHARVLREWRQRQAVGFPVGAFVRAAGCRDYLCAA